MRTRVTIIAATVALVAIVAAAWWFESSATPTTTAPPGAYAVHVTRDGTELASFGLDQLRALGVKQVTLQGGTEEGPALLDVLRAAGVTSATTVTIIGAGTRDSGRIELAYAQIGPDTVLDIAKRGTVKVAGPDIPRERRVRDVTEIQVK